MPGIQAFMHNPARAVTRIPCRCRQPFTNTATFPLSSNFTCPLHQYKPDFIDTHGHWGFLREPNCEMFILPPTPDWALETRWKMGSALVRKLPFGDLRHFLSTAVSYVGEWYLRQYSIELDPELSRRTFTPSNYVNLAQEIVDFFFSPENYDTFLCWSPLTEEERLTRKDDFEDAWKRFAAGERPESGINIADNQEKHGDASLSDWTMGYADQEANGIKVVPSSAMDADSESSGPELGNAGQGDDGTNVASSSAMNSAANLSRERLGDADQEDNNAEIAYSSAMDGESNLSGETLIDANAGQQEASAQSAQSPSPTTTERNFDPISQAILYVRSSKSIKGKDKETNIDLPSVTPPGLFQPAGPAPFDWSQYPTPQTSSDGGRTDSSPRQSLFLTKFINPARA